MAAAGRAVGPPSLRLPWLFGSLAALLFVGLAWYLAPLKPNIVALQLAFTPRAFGSIIHQWSADDLARYRAHLPVDGLLILAYSAFGYTLATRARFLTSLPRLPARLAAGCLPAAGVFDAAENLFHAWLTQAPRFGMPAVYAVSASCSALKWGLLIAFGGLVAWALLRREAAPG